MIGLLAAAAMVMPMPGHGGGHGDPGGHGGGWPEAGTAEVGMDYASFAPAHVDIVTGEEVHWANGSVRAHDVAADDGRFDSGRLRTGDTFAFRFAAPGLVAYHCRLHPGMTAEVGVSDVLLDAPEAPAAPGRAFPLTGRTALAPGTAVEIRDDAGATLATTTVTLDRSFTAMVLAGTSATVRAVAGAAVSPPRTLLVRGRRVWARAQRRRGGRVRVEVRVDPPAPGTTVVLQLRLPERFGWWPVAQARLDGRSTARLEVPLRRHVPVRVLETLSDGATVLASARVAIPRG